MNLEYRLNIPYPKCLGPEVFQILCVFDDDDDDDDFGRFALQNEVSWGWE